MSRFAIPLVALTLALLPVSAGARNTAHELSIKAALESALAQERLLDLPPGHGFSPTSFERKYLVEGRIIRRYAFARVSRPPLP